MLFGLAACINNTPLELSSRFEPPHAPGWKQDTRSVGSRVCRVNLGQATDRMSDAQSLGMVNGRPVRTADLAGWVNSALDQLSGDPRIVIQDNAPSQHADL